MTQEKKLDDTQNEPRPDQNVGIFWIVVAFVVNVLFWQPMKYLVKKAYSQSSLTRAVAYSCFGGLFAVVAAVFAAYNVGWQQGYPFYAWVPAGVFAGFGSFIYAWCPFLIWIWRPLENLSDWLWERVRINSDSSFVPYRYRKQDEKAAEGQAAENAAENQTEKPRHLTWFSHLLHAALYLSGIAGFAYLGWSVSHDYLNAGPQWLAWAVWGLVGTLAFCITAAGSWESYRLYRRMQGLAFMSGILAVYASAGYVEALELGAWSWLVYGLEFIAFCSLLFPALHTAVSECFYWAFKAVERLSDTTYGERDNKYRKFFGESVNLVIAGWVAVWAFGLFTQLAWPVAGLVLAAVLAGLLAYRIFGELISGGAFLAYIASSVKIAALIWSGRQDLHELSGLACSDAVWVGVTVAGIAFAVVLNFFIAMPIAYIVLRFVSRDVLRLAHPVGEGLKQVHNYVDARFDQLLKLFNRCYNEAYAPKPDREGDRAYRSMFLHGLNLLQALLLSSVLVWALVSASAGAVALVAAIASGVLAFSFLYVVCGKIIVEGGVKLVGNIVSLAVAIAVGAYIHLSAISGYGWLVGLLSWAVLYRFAFPLAYLALQWVLDRGSLPASLGSTLAAAHNRAWAKFLGGWMVAVQILTAISEKIARAWDRITGKKS